MTTQLELIDNQKEVPMTESAVTQLEQSYFNMPDLESPLDIAPIGGHVGAEIRGVDLSKTADDRTMAAIQAALVRHGVIFFRDQKLDDPGHAAFAARIDRSARGTSYHLQELNSADGYPSDTWHTDSTYLPSPPDVTILRSVVSPKAGGDTLWASTAAAYMELPNSLKMLVDNLWGVHRNIHDHYRTSGDEARTKEKDEWLKIYRSTTVEAEHPVVRVHPETGKRTLLVGSYLERFVGLNTSDSRHLISVLQDHITRPENTVRWRWQPGDVAMWDNRSTQHRAVVDYGSQHRVVRRTILAGSVPIGIDGRQGRALTPAPEAQSG